MTRLIFWKAENRQAIDSYDDSECNSRMLGEGSYPDFLLYPGKHTQCISVQTFSSKFKVDSCARMSGIV